MLLRLFVAHAKDTPQSDLDALASMIEQTAKAKWPHRSVVTVLGVTDYERNARRLGGWAGWTRDVATGIDPATRKPRFDAIVAPGATIGKATQSIASHALIAGKVVLVFNGPEEGFRRVTGVRADNPKDFKAGWTLV